MTTRTAKVRKRHGKWLVYRSGLLIPRVFGTHTDALAYATRWTQYADQVRSAYALCR